MLQIVRFSTNYEAFSSVGFAIILHLKSPDFSINYSAG